MELVSEEQRKAEEAARAQAEADAAEAEAEREARLREEYVAAVPDEVRVGGWSKGDGGGGTLWG